MKDKAKGFFLGGIIITAIFFSYLVTDLFQIYKGNKDIWWTPKSMVMALEDTNNNFEIFISEQPMAQLIEEGKLFAKDEKGKTYKVVSEDLGVRLNNWPTRQADLFEKALWSAFGAGFGIALLIVGFNLRLFLKKAKE